MVRALKELDRILRGEATQLPALRDAALDLSVRRLAVVLIALGGLYGLCMGSYAVFRDNLPGYRSDLQLLASTVKVPALFLLTLLVTFPSLYVFNALVGSRLSIAPLLRLLVASLGVNLAVLASLGPIVAFFGVSTTSYPFMVLLNVAVFAIAGALGLMFLLQTLHRMTLAQLFPPGAAASALPTEQPILAEDVSEARLLSVSPLDRVEGHVLGRHVKTVFYCWVVVFALVGGQMGWVLRPFVGDPGGPFRWFREREGNFFETVWETLVHLLLS